MPISRNEKSEYKLSKIYGKDYGKKYLYGTGNRTFSYKPLTLAQTNLRVT